MDQLGPDSRQLEAARLRIVHLKLDASEDLWRVVEGALRTSALSLGVARVGLWLLSADRRALHEIVLHGEDTGRRSLPLDAWPRYLEAVLSRRVVAADDARTDPRTAELTDAYLAPLAITSMLDAPVFIAGEVWGIVCHEHVGRSRTWSPREVDFAVSVADMLSALLEQSARLRAEKSLRAEEATVARIRRAEMLVRTAAGIGHDFNTVLQAITLAAERASTAADDQVRQSAIRTIIDDARRGSRITRQLVELARPRERPHDKLDLAFVVEDLRTTIETLLGERHSLVTELASNALVPATRADVERIVLNLATNARDAMPDGGTVTIRVAASGGTVSLTVRDEGAGIEPEVLDRIFEPYFTTREGRSSGLGLFAVETIAALTGGRISVDSDVGAGTAITVTWPA
jgi:signal transduction histidine kinase